jgi:hypothetical protein
MKIRSKAFAISVVLLLATNAFAAKYGMQFVELHGEFLGNLKYNPTGAKVGQFGIGLNGNIGFEYFQLMMEYDYRRLDVSGLSIPNLDRISVHEVYGGVRFCPMHPAFELGNIAVRVTAGAMAGIDFQYHFRTLVFGGLVFTPITSLIGLTVDFAYRPGEHFVGGEIGGFKGYKMDPSWTIRAGLIIGPSIY